MSDRDKTKAQLLKEVAALRQELARLKAIEDDYDILKNELAAIESRLHRYPSELDETTRFLDSIIENIPNMIFVKDAEALRFARFNKAGEDLLGISREDMLGKNDYDFFPQEEADFFVAKDREVLTKATLVDIPEEPVRTAAGNIRFLHTRKVPLLGADGKPKYLLGISEDITDRKLAEKTLRKRAAELEAVARVSMAASRILDTDRLLQEVADLTKEHFGLYHAHIYLLNETRDTLKLAAGAAEVGRHMVAQGWSIPYHQERSLVARAARTRGGVIVNDVYQDPNFLPNSLLPDTRSEMAVPIVVGDKLLGVLDVQSNQVDYFTEEDVRIQTTLAAQVAVALQNASLYVQTQAALTETEVLYDLSAELNATATLDDALQAVISPSIATGAHSAFLYTIQVDPANRPQSITLRAAWAQSGQSTLPIGKQFQVPDHVPVSAWLEAPDDLLIEVDDIFHDAAPLDSRSSETDEQAGALAKLTLPLKIGDSWIGFITIHWSSPRVFSEKEQRLYISLSAQAAVVVNNRVLFEKTQNALTEVRRLAAIVENHSDFIGIGSLDGKVLYLNPAAQKLIGLPPDYDLKMLTIRDFYPVQDREKLVREGIPLALKKGAWSTEANLQKLDGTTIPVEQMIGINYDEEGTAYSFSLTMRDIGERKQAEMALRQSELRNRALLNAIPDLIIRYSRDGIHLDVKPPKEFVTFLPPDDLIGKGMLQVMGAELAEQRLHYMERAWHTGEIQVYEHQFQRNDQLRFEEVRVVPSGDSEAFVIVRDITERRAAEAERERLLAEVQHAHRQYVRREWEQFLGEEHQGNWHIEHQHSEPAELQDRTAEEGIPLVASIAVRGQTVGTLSLRDADPNRQWTDEEMALVETVSEQLGLTIENLRLFRNTQKQAIREQLARQVTDKMRASPDIDSIITTGLSELAKALGVSRTYIKFSSAPARTEITPDKIKNVHAGS